MARKHLEVPGLVVAAFSGFAAQAKSVRFRNSALHTLLLVLIQMTRRGRKGYELDQQRYGDDTAIYWTVLDASMCLTYCPVLPYRPIDTHKLGLSCTMIGDAGSTRPG